MKHSMLIIAACLMIGNAAWAADAKWEVVQQSLDELLNDGWSQSR